jgi:hypothetical protein
VLCSGKCRHELRRTDARELYLRHWPIIVFLEQNYIPSSGSSKQLKAAVMRRISTLASISDKSMTSAPWRSWRNELVLFVVTHLRHLERLKLNIAYPVVAERAQILVARPHATAIPSLSPVFDLLRAAGVRPVAITIKGGLGFWDAGTPSYAGVQGVQRNLFGGIMVGLIPFPAWFDGTLLGQSTSVWTVSHRRYVWCGEYSP